MNCCFVYSSKRGDALLSRIGHCELRPIYREKNSFADRLANWSHNFDLGLCILEDPLCGLAL